MIRYFSGEDGYATWEGWLFATGVVMGSVLYILTHHPYFFGVQYVGMLSRISSCSLIYRKVFMGVTWNTFDLSLMK